MWEFFDSFSSFFTEIGNFTSLLAECFNNMPSIFKFVLSFIIIVAVLAGGLYMIFKLIG